ncbi:hypothetical protein C9439_06735 [archaeon SCG-AAA382B04]|nr:hypothetical protein C9439_06735 [archaeon SCG-AAA382B04]
MGFLFLIVGIGVFFIASGKAPYIIELIPYAALISAISFVASTTFLDYRGEKIKKALYFGGLSGIISFVLIISMIEGIMFLIEKNFTNQSYGILLISFSFCIVASTVLLWLIKSRFY